MNMIITSSDVIAVISVYSVAVTDGKTYLYL